MVRLLLTFGPILCSLAGCGYGLAGNGLVLRGVRTLHVGTYSSDARDAGVGALFARALRLTLAGRAGLRLAGAESADALVAGRIERLDFAPMAFPGAAVGTATVRAGEFRASARLKVVVRRRVGGAVLFSSGTFTVSGEYLRGADVLGTESNRERTLRQLASDAARRVANLLTDSF